MEKDNEAEKDRKSLLYSVLKILKTIPGSCQTLQKKIYNEKKSIDCATQVI